MRLMKKASKTNISKYNATKAIGLLTAFVFLLVAAGCSVDVSAESGGLIISEVVSANSNSVVDPLLGRPDWIELSNTSKGTIDLTKYSIAESNSNKFEFPEGTTIGAGEYLIVYCCTAVEGTPEDVLCTGFKLSKSGTPLTLSSQYNTIQTLTVPPLETDVSYGITETGEYAYFAVPTPGKANDTQSFTELSFLESDSSVKLQINEVMAKSQSESQPYAWAEVYNAGDTAVKLSDYYITENPSDPMKARLPEKELGPGEYTVVHFTGGSGEDEVPFKISSGETSLVISNNFGTQVARFTWDEAILPGISAGPDSTGSTVYFTTPTPGESNGESQIKSMELTEGTGAVRINEVLLKNTFSLIDKDGNRSQWVELNNTSGSAVSLSGLALSDSLSDPWKWSMPDIQLGAGEYIIVFLSGKDVKEGELHANFSIGSDETELFLTDIAAGKIQTVKLPTERRSNISFGFSQDGQWYHYPQPTPNAPNDTQGFTELSSAGEPPGIIINEVASVSAVKSGSPDWVELYNSTSSNISLEGYFLSDSDSDLQKWPLGDVTVKSDGYAVIKSYTKDDITSELSISLSGETLYLTNPDGEVLDSFSTGALRPGLSSGISEDGTKAIFTEPTQGKSNSTSTVQGYCVAPVFSKSGGYVSSSFSLEMSTATEGGEIYYTLDGSTPSENSTKYTGPVKISGNENIRAITAADGKLVSDETVATYIFDKQHKLPVVCISITKSDYSTVVNSERDNKKERAGYVEYYEADGTLGIRFPAGLRVAGAGTIHAQQRSLNLYLRGGYGMSSVTYPFFEGYDITTFTSLSLRNMGAWQDQTRLKDVFISLAANGLNVDNAQSKFAAVYINGEYWGLYEFKENQNEDYFAARYGIDPDKVVMVRANKYNVETGNTDRDIVSLYSLAQKNMNDTDNFDKYISLADSDYFMDYLIAETFFVCSDTYNQKYAHTTDNTLKWRPVYYDFDLCLGSANADLFNKYFCDIYTRKAETSIDGPHETWMYLYNAFRKNDEWAERFVERYAEVLNTTLTNENLLALFDELTASIKDEIPLTAKKWSDPSSASQWNKDISSLRNIVEKRRSYIIKQLKSYFQLSNERMRELFPNDNL